MIRTGKNAYIEDAQSPDYVDHVIARDVGFRHMLGVPTRVGGTVWVIIVLTFKSGKKPGPAYVAMVETFAGQAGIGIGNASLFAQTQAARVREQASAQIL